MPMSSSTWNSEAGSGDATAGQTERRAPADAACVPPACDDLEVLDEEPAAPRFQFGLSALFAVVAICGLLTFALVHAGENSVATAVATVLAVVVLSSPVVVLAARGHSQAVTYGAVFLLLGGVAAGLVTLWVVHSVRIARSLNETDDLRQIGGGIIFRQDTGRPWQGIRSPTPAAGDPAQSINPVHADPAEVAP